MLLRERLKLERKKQSKARKELMTQIADIELRRLPSRTNMFSNLFNFQNKQKDGQEGAGSGGNGGGGGGNKSETKSKFSLGKLKNNDKNKKSQQQPQPTPQIQQQVSFKLFEYFRSD